ncbi:hypothetical protein GQ457_06G029470 [Hibiscus cannabinus]
MSDYTSTPQRAAVAASLPHQPRSNALSLALSSTLQFVVSFIFVYFDAAPFFFSVAYTHSSVYLTVPSIIIGSFRKAGAAASQFTYHVQ